MSASFQLDFDSIVVHRYVAPTAEETAYIAGFFDGEGWITVKNFRAGNGRRHIFLEAGIAQNDQVVLFWIASKLGGRVKQWKQRKCSYWTVTTQAEQLVFLTSVLPYVRVKRAKVEAALAFLVVKQAHNGKHRGAQRLTEAEREAQEIAFARFKATL
jgi:hypothetical protein